MRTFTTLGFAALLALACSNEEPAPEGAAGDSGKGSGGAGGTASGQSGAGGSPAAGASGTATAGSASGSAGAAGNAGSSAAGSGTGGGAGSGSGGAAGTSGGPASGGTSAGGAGGVLASAGAGAGGMAGSLAGGGSGGASGQGGAPPSSFTCNQVVGIDSTSEWFTSGFEDDVDNAKWQIVYFHPGYIENWADAADEVWSLQPTSACAQNANNPDRVVLNVFADTADSSFTNKNAWVTGLTQAITNFKNKYSRLQRIDILTMTRAPGNNPPCNNSGGQPQRMSIVESYVDEAIAMVVANATGPVLVTDVPDFFAPNCNVFTDGGPHFSDAGKPIVAGIYGDYYSAEP